MDFRSDPGDSRRASAGLTRGVLTTLQVCCFYSILQQWQTPDAGTMSGVIITITLAFLLNRREGQQARVHFQDYSILHFYLGENLAISSIASTDAFSHMSFISSCSCDSLYSTLCFYITRIFSTSHTYVSVYTISYRFLINIFSIHCVYLRLRFIVSHLSRLLKIIFTSVITFLIYSSLCVSYFI